MSRVKIDERQLAALLEWYTTAMAVHEHCLTTLIDVMVHGEAPSPALASEERRSQDELSAARRHLIRALAVR
jgi:hypothetical protein